MTDKKIRAIVNLKGTRYMNVGDLIPEDWRFVTANKIRQTKNTVTIQVRKLLGEEQLASDTALNQEDKQDTSTSR